MFAKLTRVLSIFILAQYFWIVGPDPSRKMEGLPAPLMVHDEVIQANMEKTFFHLLSCLSSLMQVMNPQDPFPIFFFSYYFWRSFIPSTLLSWLNRNMKIDIAVSTAGEWKSQKKKKKGVLFCFSHKEI